ncbi:MAG: cytochrome c biogenesis protein ResB [Mangrovibacterium sp.]
MNNTKVHSINISLWVIIVLNLLGGFCQFILGAFSIRSLAFPNHTYLFFFVVSLSIIFGQILNKSKIGILLSSYQSALLSIANLTFWAIILGITTQFSTTAHSHDLLGHAGVRQMTTFYPFVFAYIYLLICLSFATVRRFRLQFTLRNIGFFLNHAGLLFTLYFIGAGAADVKQYTMTVQEGKTEWRGVEEKSGEVAELPIAIKLHDFTMEEFAPKLAVVHRGSGKVMPEELPEYLDIDTLKLKGDLLEWEIVIHDFFMNGIRANDSTYQEIMMPGACPAAFISAKNSKTGEFKKSWISAGNNMQLYKFLPIGNEIDSLVIAMTQPEPKAFYSDVDVYLKSGDNILNQRIEVNHPLSADHWMIYQSDYDKALGTMSITSVFDLVFDPWRIYIIISTLMLVIGSLFLFWRVDKHKSQQKK